MSHAALISLPALAELTSPIGVGSGDLLGIAINDMKTEIEKLKAELLASDACHMDALRELESVKSAFANVEKKLHKRLRKYKLNRHRATALNNKARWGCKYRATMECLRDVEYERMAAMPNDES